MAKFVYSLQLQMREPAELGKIVRNIESQFSGIDATVKVNVKSQGVASTIRQVKELKQATAEANNTAEALAKTFAISFKRFVTFSLATRTVGAFTSGLSSAFNEAIDFEKQMVRVSQVTGKTLPDLRDLNKEITRLAVGLGVSSKTLLDVSLTLAQAGFSANDTKVALEALAKTELAPTFTDIKKTTEGAIALFNQFGEGAGALAGQLGAINKVSADFAVESDDLIDVVRRVGGVFKASGGSLNELLAIFTSVRATTRESAESIGTALKTIFVRIQRPQTLEYLKKLGVDLKDVEGKFVGPLKATQLLNEAFGKLEQGDPKFIQIAEELGGYRQIGKVIPLLQQYAIAEKALQSAKKGAGSLDSDAAKAQETLANKIVKVKEEFEALVRSIYESPVFQTMANSSLQFASSLLKVASALKDIIPLIGIFATLKIAKTAGSFLGSFGRNLKNPQGFAEGGPVPGAGNKDSVPAMLMPGEFVLNKKAVSKIGMGRLNSMNNGGTPDTKDGVQYFADGGFVTNKKKRVGGFFLAGTKSGKASSNYVFDNDIVRKDKDKQTHRLFAGSDIDTFVLSRDDVQKNENIVGMIKDDVKQNVLPMVNAITKTLSKQLNMKPIITPDTAEMLGVEKNLVNDSGLISTITGYMTEGAYHALTGLPRQGGNSTFDFLFKDISSETKEKLAELFSEPVSKFDNLTHIDAKPYLDAKQTKEIGQKMIRSATDEAGKAESVISTGTLTFKKDRANSDPASLLPYSRDIKEKPKNTQGDLRSKLESKGLGAREINTVLSRLENKDTSYSKTLNSALKRLGVSSINDVLNFNTGGSVPGVGNKDSVPAMLTPGEFVLNKKAVKKYGMSKLMQMNGGAIGKSKDGIQHFSTGGPVDPFSAFKVTEKKEEKSSGGLLGGEVSKTTQALFGLGATASVLSQSLSAVIDPASALGQGLSVASTLAIQFGTSFGLFKIGLEKAKGGIQQFTEFMEANKSEAPSVKGSGIFGTSTKKDIEQAEAKKAKYQKANERKKKDYFDAEIKARDFELDPNNEGKKKSGDKDYFAEQKRLRGIARRERYDFEASSQKLEKVTTNAELVKGNTLKGRVTSNPLVSKGISGIKSLGLSPGALAGAAGFAVGSGLDTFAENRKEVANKQLENGEYSKFKSNSQLSIGASALGGAAKGAGTGAAIGSLFGPIGTAAGAAAGGLIGFVAATADASKQLKDMNLKIFDATMEQSAKAVKNFENGVLNITQYLDKREDAFNAANDSRRDAGVKESEEKAGYFGTGGYFDRSINGSLDSRANTEARFGKGIAGRTAKGADDFFSNSSGLKALTGYNISDYVGSYTDSKETKEKGRNLGYANALAGKSKVDLEKDAETFQKQQGSEGTNLSNIIGNKKFSKANQRLALEGGKDEKGKAVVGRKQELEILNKELESTKNILKEQGKLNGEVEKNISAKQEILRVQKQQFDILTAQLNLEEKLSKLESVRMKVLSSFRGAELNASQKESDLTSGSTSQERVQQDFEFSSKNIGRLPQALESIKKASEEQIALSGGANSEKGKYIQESADTLSSTLSNFEKIRTNGFDLNKNDGSSEKIQSIKDQIEKGFNGNEIGKLLAEKVSVDDGILTNGKDEEIFKAVLESLEKTFDENKDKLGGVILDSAKVLGDQQRKQAELILKVNSAYEQQLNSLKQGVDLRREGAQFRAEGSGRIASPGESYGFDVQKANLELSRVDDTFNGNGVVRFVCWYWFFERNS